MGHLEVWTGVRRDVDWGRVHPRLMEGGSSVISLRVTDLSTITLPMDDTRRPDHGALFGVASEQGGYFTARQAHRCGFSRANLSHHAASGRFVRVGRGLYRLRAYPSSPREEVFRAWLWFGKDTAVVSHESALDLLGISDVVPDQVHLTVPRTRRGRPAAPGVHVHTAKVPPERDETTLVEGVRITSPARSIADAAAAGTSPEHILAAARRALARGMVTPQQLEWVARQRGGWVARIIHQALDAAASS